MVLERSFVIVLKSKLRESSVLKTLHLMLRAVLPVIAEPNFPIVTSKVENDQIGR